MSYLQNHEMYHSQNVTRWNYWSKYYLPEGVPNLFSPSFCDKDSNDWTTNGVPKENRNLPDSCIANNNAITKILNEPYDVPGVLYGDKTSEYSSLFNFFSNPGVMARSWA